METGAYTDVEGGATAVIQKKPAPADFTCPVCMDLLFKPCVNNCGHTFCFWCMHHAMNPFRPSQCPLCRSPYTHFPRVCLPLHHFLETSFPERYAERERENRELEDLQGVQSPDLGQLPDVQPPAVPEPSPPTASPRNGDEPTPISTTHAAEGAEAMAPAAVKDVALPYRCSNPACGRLAYRPCVLSCGCLVCGPCGSGCGPAAEPPPQQGPSGGTHLQQQTKQECIQPAEHLAEHKPTQQQHQDQRPPPPQQQLQQQRGESPRLCPCCKRSCMPPNAQLCLALQEALRCLFPEQYQQMEQDIATAAAAAAAAATAVPADQAAATADVDVDAGSAGGSAAGMMRGGTCGAGGGCVEQAGAQDQHHHQDRDQRRASEREEAGSQRQPQPGGGLTAGRPRSKLPRIDALIAAAAAASAVPAAAASAVPAAAASAVPAAAAASGGPAAPTVADIWSALREELAANADTCFTWYSVGCDDCGVFPIVGRRYRCRDCSEAIGFDLCGACFDRGTAGRGRFNQAHTLHHRMDQVQPWFGAAGCRGEACAGSDSSGGGPNWPSREGIQILTLMNCLEVLHPELTVEQATSLVLMHLGEAVLDLDALGGGRGSGGGGGLRMTGAVRAAPTSESAAAAAGDGMGILGRATAASRSAAAGSSNTTTAPAAAPAPADSGSELLSATADLSSERHNSGGGERGWRVWVDAGFGLRRRTMVPEVAPRQHSFSSARPWHPSASASAAAGGSEEGEDGGDSTGGSGARSPNTLDEPQLQRSNWLRRQARGGNLEARLLREGLGSGAYQPHGGLGAGRWGGGEGHSGIGCCVQ